MTVVGFFCQNWVFHSFPKLMSQHMTTCPFWKNFMHDSGSQMCCVETARVCNLPFLLIFSTTQSQHSGKWLYHNVSGMYMAAWTAWIYDAFENLSTSKKNSFRRNLQLYVTLSSLQIMSFSPIGPEVCKESGSAVCPLCCGLLPEPKLWCFDRWADFCLLAGVVPDFSCTCWWQFKTFEFLRLPCKTPPPSKPFDVSFPLGAITQQSPDALRIRVLDPAKVRVRRLSTTRGPVADRAWRPTIPHVFHWTCGPRCFMTHGVRWLCFQP